MVVLYSIKWEKLTPLPQPRKRKLGNFITVRMTGLDENGKIHKIERLYEDWFGVCTDKIEKVVAKIKCFFPECSVRYELLDETVTYKKVLPYLETRLKSDAVGQFFDLYKIAYYEKADWLVRIYLDLCAKFKTKSFYYKWYEVCADKHLLTDSLVMLTERFDPPNWTIVSFDLETVPMDGQNRVPTGHDPSDRIVMISIVKWNKTFRKNYVLYLNPVPTRPLDLLCGDVTYLEYSSESNMLNDCCALFKDCQVITGYNILKFDLPCIMARLMWLKLSNLLVQFSSKTIGDYAVPTFQGKIVLDMYVFIQIYSSFDVPGFKLDVVAKAKLDGVGKVAVKSTGIHYWYTNKNVTTDLLLSNDPKRCYEFFRPKNIREEEFGTFCQYIEYCYRDSDLVYRLFEKEMALYFLVERANFTATSVSEALHYGNSRFLLHVFKTYGTTLGFFVNVNCFKNSAQADGTRYSPVFVGRNQETFQGALNFCAPETYYKNVSVLDFTSMYPCALLSSNLCYGTCSILKKEEYLELNDAIKAKLQVIPYRNHTERDFNDSHWISETFAYPQPAETDKYVIVIKNRDGIDGFLPALVEHFLRLRKDHQKKWKETKNVFHYNTQQCIKILINSLYGVMASKDSPLAYLAIAMTIVNLSRYQLLGSYHYLSRCGYKTCYADTDSLMVCEWPYDHCDPVNNFLNIKHVDLKFEHRMRRVLIISKKRYVYESQDGKLHWKGFQKRTNDLIQYMTDNILGNVMQVLENGERGEVSDGWILWVQTLVRAFYMCRDPKKFAITRKTKSLDEYKSTSCTAVKILQKYPEKAGEYVDFTYSRADVAASEASQWIMDADDCKYVDFEQLFKNQKKIFCILLNIGYWGYQTDPTRQGSAVLNIMRWKCFVNAELKLYMQTGKRIMLLFEKGFRFTFNINEITEDGLRQRVVEK